MSGGDFLWRKLSCTRRMRTGGSGWTISLLKDGHPGEFWVNLTWFWFNWRLKTMQFHCFYGFSMMVVISNSTSVCLLQILLHFSVLVGMCSVIEATCIVTCIEATCPFPWFRKRPANMESGVGKWVSYLKREKKLDSLVGRRPTAPPAPKGLYIYGNVGSGIYLVLFFFWIVMLTNDANLYQAHLISKY